MFQAIKLAIDKSMVAHPWRWGITSFIFFTLPSAVSGAWSLYSNEPLFSVLNGTFKVMDISFSPYWITTPLGFLMFAYLIYALEFKKPGAPTTSLRQSVAYRLSQLRSDPIKIVLIMGVAILAVMNLSLQTRVKRLESKMVRYVVPRELTPKQIEDFGAYLKANSKSQEVTIKYVMGDSEASRYAGDFAAAFKAGDWFPNMRPINSLLINCSNSVAGPVCKTELQEMMNRLEGVAIYQTGPNPPRSTSIEEKIHPPKAVHLIITEALTAAGIRGISAGYSYSDEPLNTVTVYVGSRKRDKWAVPPKDYSRHLTPDAITDDDF